jgi:hypothetical protein
MLNRAKQYANLDRVKYLKSFKVRRCKLFLRHSFDHAMPVGSELQLILWCTDRPFDPNDSAHGGIRSEEIGYLAAFVTEHCHASSPHQM